MTGKGADLKIVSFSIHHWDFIKNKNKNKKTFLSVWDGGEKTCDDSEVCSGNLEVHLLYTVELQG